MIFRYKQLQQHPAIFLKVTGLQLFEFEDLLDDVLPRFAQTERQRLDRPDRKRGLGAGQKAELDSLNQVLLTVVWLRLYLVHDVLGYLFGISQPTVGRYISRVLPVLEAAGRDTMRMPDPGRKRRRSLDRMLQEIPELAIIVDSFEQKVQRPKDKDKRDKWYSGKKKSHTMKSQIAVDGQTGRIVAVSDSVTGRTSDINLLKQSGLLDQLPPGIGCVGDLGYQGIQKLYPLGFCPRKKPRDKPRPAEDTLYNRAFAQFRILVENTINRLRRYQVLTATDRHHRQRHSMRVMAVAGLVNIQMVYRLDA